MSTKTLKVLEIIKQLLLGDYQNDTELTPFTVLDNEDFH